MVNWDFHLKVYSHLHSISNHQDEQEKKNLLKQLKKHIKTEYSKDANSILERLNELETDVIILDVPQELMDSFKEAVYSYTNEQYKSTIATVGITAELFSVHLYSKALEKQNIVNSEVKTRIKEFSKLHQHERLKLLCSTGVISIQTNSKLTEITRIRNDNIHPENNNDQKRVSLGILKTLSSVLNEYSTFRQQEKNEQSIIEKIPSFLGAMSDGGHIFIGNKNADIKIVSFLDLQCPFSRSFFVNVFPEIKQKYIDTNQISFTIIAFPLDFHPLSKTLAEIAYYVDEKYEKDVLLKLINKIAIRLPDEITENLVNTVLEELKITESIKEMSLITAELVKNDSNETVQLGITGTPSFIIQNQLLVGAYPLSVFEQIIEEKIKDNLYKKYKNGAL